jgi:predicted Zn-dependent protease
VAVSEEWFRSRRWDEASRTAFEQRLSHARLYNRPQYLRIKALALRDAGLLDATRSLLLRVTTQYPQTSDAAHATELLGDLALQQRRPREAESYYRAVLSGWPHLSGTSGMVEVSLAEILTEYGRESSWDEALQLLQSRLHRNSMMHSDLFRWHLALIAVADRLGDEQTRRQAARTALSLVGRDPQFARHPTVGVVKVDEQTLAWLGEAAHNTTRDGLAD